jgi:hypothetical protein
MNNTKEKLVLQHHYLKLLNPNIFNSNRIFKRVVSIATWENEHLEFERRDGRFECIDGKKLLIYGVHSSSLVS